jgi:aconitate hydratase
MEKALTLSEKIIKKHLVSGEMKPGEDITVKLDQCLLQDATGTMAWLEFEAIGAKKVKPRRCTQYIDHNLLQADNKNMDDHLFLMTITSKYGAYVSLPGNGISHHVHKERFTRPGELMIGSDSHTPTSGGSTMIAIGVGGLDVAVGMATGHYTFQMPRIVGVHLTGSLQDWCTAKDVILELLRRVDVDGGKGKIFEFFGDGVKTLSVAERSTITNMGAETGATTSIFPSDKRTREFFTLEKREGDFVALAADKGAVYSDIIKIDLSKIVPLIACPYSPGNVKTVKELADTEVAQAMIGSSTNSSYEEMMSCAYMLTKKPRHMQTMFHLIPGSRQVLATIERDGGLMTFIKNGVRIAEPSCNACIGMGNAPASNVVSVRSFPRNWEGRSGTPDDQVFLSSPETATACAITGKITDPRDLGIKYKRFPEPRSFVIDDSLILKPTFKDMVKRGPNIKKLPPFPEKIPDMIAADVVIKVADDISTDHIMPAGAQVLPLRSNIPAISEFVFRDVDKNFVARCKEKKKSFIVAGANYGQGSSREHAALAPQYLGIKAVLAMDIARIHRSNLINFGILPIAFAEKKEYGKIEQDHRLEINNISAAIKGDGKLQVVNKTTNVEINVMLNLTNRERQLLLKGGLLNFVKEQLKGAYDRGQ